MMPRTQDFVMAECLTFDEKGKDGVTPARLLDQANKVLKVGGILVIETANTENSPTAQTPNRVDFADLMTSHGFETVVEVDTYAAVGNDVKQQWVRYFGKKAVEGYDPNRLQKPGTTGPGGNV
jgi:hypothetical protein